MLKKISLIDGERGNWLYSHLTRKMIAVLFILGIVTWVVITCVYSNYMGKYSDNLYNEMANEASEKGQLLCAYIDGSDGDAQKISEYAKSQNIYCEVRCGGNIVYENLAFDDDRAEITAHESTSVTLGDGRIYTVRTWATPHEKGQIAKGLQQSAMLGISIISVCVFVALGLVIYFLIIHPITRLRKQMKCYYELGKKPEHTVRDDELGKLQNTFAQMVDVIDAKEEAEHQMVASISHDLKTPLTSVLGFSERLISNNLSDDKKLQYQHSIYDKALAIKSIVDEFDEYIEMGVRNPAPEKAVSVKELSDMLRREYSDELSDAGVEFQIECLCPDEKIKCDFDGMRRYFGNLISNSIQHSGAEKLVLSLVFERSGNHIIMRFSDNGRGAPPDAVDKLFEPFFTTDRGRKVSGLGLSICRGIIQTHGGTIAAANSSAGGLVIEAAIPRA